MFQSLRRALLTASILVVGSAHIAQALDVGPKAVPIRILGVPVEVLTTATVNIQTDADKITADVAATGDLKSLQDNALALARKLPFPDDTCARKGANMVVNSIDAASITPAGNSAMIHVSGHVTAWACAKVLGAKVKTKIASDTVAITIPVELYVPRPQQIALRVKGTVDVKTGDPNTAEAAAMLVGDLNTRLTAAVAKALDTSSAQAVVPAIPGLDVTISQATFAQDQDRLLVKTQAHASATGAALGDLLDMWSKKAP